MHFVNYSNGEYFNETSLPEPKIGFVYRDLECNCYWSVCHISNKKYVEFDLYELCNCHSKQEAKERISQIFNTSTINWNFSKLDIGRTLKNMKRKKCKRG
jgi:hypothetical protein